MNQRTLGVLVVVFAVLGLALAPGCRKTPAQGAEAAAERFLDLYFLEIDQERALEVTSGFARETLQRELAEVAAVRAGGYMPSEAKARAFYERAWTGPATEGAVRFVYDITIESGDDSLHRHVLLTLRQDAGTWKVATFTIRDGKMLRQPAGGAAAPATGSP